MLGFIGVYVLKIGRFCPVKTQIDYIFLPAFSRDKVL